MAMRLMGEQFVTGETIAEALANARKLEDKGFRYSYDMLGEAALTAADAQAYMVSYQQAIHAIGKASNGRGIYEGPGISIALRPAPALQPRAVRPGDGRALPAPEIPCWRASMTLASTSTPKRQTVWRSRSICWKNCALSQNWQAGTELALLFRLPETLPVRY